MPTPVAAAANAYAALARIGEQTASLGRSTAAPDSGPNFSAVLKDVINAVSDAAQKSDAQAHAVATGKSNMVDVVHRGRRDRNRSADAGFGARQGDRGL